MGRSAICVNKKLIPMMLKNGGVVEILRDMEYARPI